MIQILWILNLKQLGGLFFRELGTGPGRVPGPAGRSSRVLGASVRAHDSQDRAHCTGAPAPRQHRRPVDLEILLLRNGGVGPRALRVLSSFIHSAGTCGAPRHSYRCDSTVQEIVFYDKLWGEKCYGNQTPSHTLFGSWPLILRLLVTCPAQTPRQHPTGVQLLQGSSPFLQAPLKVS